MWMFTLKEERSHINNSTLHLKELEKEGKINSISYQKEENNKEYSNKREINKTNTKILEEINKARVVH